MKIIKKNFYRIIVLIIIFVLVTPVDIKGVLNFSKAEENEIVGKIIWNEDHEIDGTLIIQPGATLIIKNDVTITFGENWPRLIVLGNLFVSGTVNHPVYFKKSESSNGYSVNIDNEGKAIVRNADISGGGMYFYLIENNLKFINTAYANNYEAGFLVKDGELEIQGTKFHDNKMAIGVENTADAQKVKIQRSSFINNETDIYNENNASQVDARYNWWGDETGPSEECYMYNSQENCYYDKMSGFVSFEPILTSEKFYDPVIIVPGILGSWKITDGGEWKADPIFKTYDSLYKTFEENGYQKDKDLFVFPYQWRDSNINNAVLLKQKIQEIKTANNDWPKVDVIAHSMGGLLTREYIESDEYQNDIDQLVMLGTPNSGSPKDYIVWDGGKFSVFKTDLLGFFAEKVFKQEAKEAGFDSIFEYLHNEPIVSVQELLADYDYLYDVSSEKMRSYINGEHYPKNIFLENLNDSENIKKMNLVTVTNITGKLDGDTTVTKINVEKPSIDENSIWAHGMPENFDSLFGDHGLEYGEGDGTVPKESGENIFSDEQIETAFSHSQLPSKTAEIVFEKITGNLVQKEIPFVGTDSVLVVFVFSPIDIQIISPSGKKVGKNFETGEIYNEIEGAYYTGYETDNEFLTIPNPENGEYKIISQGTGDGGYRIEMARISEDENGQASEITGEIIGMASNGVQTEKIVEVLEDEIVTEEEDTTSPTIEITSPQNKIYQSDEIVSIEFNAQDDDSGINNEKTKVTLDEEIFSKDKIDMAYLEKGEHSLKISVEDNAGNLNEEIVTFSIKSNSDSLMKNVEHYYSDKYITKKSTKNYLKAKIKIIGIHQKIYTLIKLNYWSNNFKKKLLKRITKFIDREIDSLIKDIQTKKQISKTILEPACKILVGNLGEMRV